MDNKNFLTKKGIWHVIGLMSGTSLDGVDLAYIRFVSDSKLDYKILHAETIPYTKAWKKKLSNAFTASAKEITYLNVVYAKFLGKLVKTFIAKHQLKDIDFIASHGHTVFHKPEKGYTLQIGDGATITQTCKQTVICDFRTQDVAMGGQGAPLVPVGDKLLFSKYDYCINIGGFCNISFDDENNLRRAYDVCPANIVMNHYTRKIGLEYDDQGNIAKKGKLNNKLLATLQKLPLYKSKQSMGNEIVVSDFLPLIDSYHIPLEDILRTFVEHIALKTAEEIKDNTTVLITGGGAFNNFLIERIKKHTKSKIIIPDNKLINYKEALIFGLLGLLRASNEVNCLSSVTGAVKNHSTGVIYLH